MNIFRRRGSPHYYTRFRYKGRQHVQSTDTTDARLARQILSKRYTEAVEGKHLDKVKPRKHAEEILAHLAATPC